MEAPGGTVLVNCHLVDLLHERVEADQGIWMENGGLRRVGPVDEVLAEARRAPGAVIADVDGAHLLPGLMNLHTHFGLVHSSGKQDRSPAARALRMASTARNCLRAGVTTVRLVGEYDHTDFDLRNAIDAGHTTGPRIFTAGQALSCTGGHGSGGGALELDGPAEFARGVRRQVSMGADLIKVCISGGIGGVHEQIGHSQLTPEEIRSVTSVAHGWGRKVTAHAGPAEAISEAIDSGLDGVEHGYAMNDAVVQQMAKAGTWLVPTLVVSRAEEFYKRLGAPSYVIEKALAAGEGHLQGIKAAVSAGVRIALGTDMVPQETFEGTTATVRELEFLVDAGLTPAGALRAATLNAAEYLGISREAGSIAEGKRADIVGVREDPLVDVSRMRDLRFVWKDGVSVEPAPAGILTA